jgi:hypothetical protein
MMKNHNLKIVAHSPHDELDAAIAAEAEASTKWLHAEASLAKKYPGDHRLIDVKAHWEPERIRFFEERQAVSIVKQDADAARRAVDQARVRVAEHVTEMEKRVSLAAAIKAAAETRKAVAEAQVIADRASKMVSAAQEKYNAAADAAKAAREQHSRNAEEAARTGYPLKAVSLRDTRSAEADVLDDLDAAKAAFVKTERAVAGFRAAYETSEKEISRLADDVIRASAVMALLIKARELKRNLLACRLSLIFLDQTGLVLEGESDAVADFLAGGLLPDGDSESQQRDEDAAEFPWRQAREALTRDADAPLPK